MLVPVEAVMAVIRGLLTSGLGKLGEGIHAWNLPPVSTCPGSTPTCRRACYARRHRFAYPAVKERLRWNLAQARRDDFVERMSREITRKGVLVCRIHSSGDFMNRCYAERWLAIIRARPRVTFYAYSRSHVVPAVREVLELMACEPNARIWFSLDADMARPENVPEAIRLCYLQVNADDQPENVDLVFRTQPLRRIPMPLLPVCENETPLGRSQEVTCGSCRACFE